MCELKQIGDGSISKLCLVETQKQLVVEGGPGLKQGFFQKSGMKNNYRKLGYNINKEGHLTCFNFVQQFHACK